MTGTTIETFAMRFVAEAIREELAAHADPSHKGYVLRQSRDILATDRYGSFI